MSDIHARLQNAMHIESAFHSPRTTEAIETMRAAQEEIERLTAALRAAKTEIEWWVNNHGCCSGHEDEALEKVDAALNIHKGGDE